MHSNQDLQPDAEIGIWSWNQALEFCVGIWRWNEAQECSARGIRSLAAERPDWTQCRLMNYSTGTSLRRSNSSCSRSAFHFSDVLSLGIHC